MPKRKYEYHEGPEAHGKFERTMVALFKAPKGTAKAVPGAKKKASRAADRKRKSGGKA